jgi:Trehalose utilisation
MKKLSRWFVLLAGALLLMGGSLTSRGADSASFRILVFSKTTGFRHASISNGIAALHELGAAHRFGVDASEDSGVITRTNLARYQAAAEFTPNTHAVTP